MIRSPRGRTSRSASTAGRVSPSSLAARFVGRACVSAFTTRDSRSPQLTATGGSLMAEAAWLFRPGSRTDTRRDDRAVLVLMCAVGENPALSLRCASPARCRSGVGRSGPAHRARSRRGPSHGGPYFLEEGFSSRVCRPALRSGGSAISKTPSRLPFSRTPARIAAWVSRWGRHHPAASWLTRVPPSAATSAFDHAERLVAPRCPSPRPVQEQHARWPRDASRLAAIAPVKSRALAEAPTEELIGSAAQLNRHERAMLAARALMDEARDHFLPRARLSREEHGRLRLRHPRRMRQDVLPLW